MTPTEWLLYITTLVVVMVLPANSLKTFSEGKDGAVTTPVGSALVHAQLWPGSLRFCSNYVPRRAFFAIFELVTQKVVIVRNPKHCFFGLRVFCFIGNATHLYRAFMPVPRVKLHFTPP
jgi:hypothetical protein